MEQANPIRPLSLWGHGLFWEHIKILIIFLPLVMCLFCSYQIFPMVHGSVWLRLLAWPKLWSCWQNSSRRARHGKTFPSESVGHCWSLNHQKLWFNQGKWWLVAVNRQQQWEDFPSGMIETVYLDTFDQDLTSPAWCWNMLKWIGDSISPESSFQESLPNLGASHGPMTAPK